MSYSIVIHITSLDGVEREAVLSQALSDLTRHEFKRAFENFGWSELSFENWEDAIKYVRDHWNVMPDFRGLKECPPIYYYWKEGTEDYEILSPATSVYKEDGQLCLFATIQWNKN